MNKPFYRQRERGISIPMVLSLIAVMMILALTFMGVTRFQTQRTGFEQATITSAYVAEIGFQQVRAKLSAIGGDWTQLPASEIEQNCTAGNPNRLRCQKSPVNDTFTNRHPVYENPLDTTSRIIGRYEYTIETGQKRGIFGNKTVLGSDVGFLPGDPVEQVGYDVYGNKLCDASVPGGTCPGNFVGVKVKAWLTNAEGTEIPNARPQTVYGVLSMDSRDPDDQGPSGYMLESDESMQISANSVFSKGSTWGFTSYGGFYGPVHTNENFSFQWESEDHNEASPTGVKGSYTITKGPKNTADMVGDPSPWTSVDNGQMRPFWGILMTDIGTITTPRLRFPGVNYDYKTYGEIFHINWGAGLRPANGSTYTVSFRKPNGTIQNVSVVRNPAIHPNKDFVLSPLHTPYEVGPISNVTQGATTFTAGLSQDYTYSNHHDLLWNAYGTAPYADEYDPGDTYRARFISHSPIRIQNEMSYSGGSPEYKYRHTHAMDSNAPTYQVAHGHNDFVGINLGTAAITDYDGLTWTHTHPITADLTLPSFAVTPPALPIPNTFLSFDNTAYYPKSVARHEVPLLSPSANITQYKNQLEQLNKYLELTLGVTLPRNGDGSLNATPLGSAPYNATDYNKGYIIGKFPATHPNTTPAQVDFRAVYFGTREQTYTAGTSIGQKIITSSAPYSQTAAIWVDSNPSSSTYMAVASERVSGNYLRYLFRQIPPEKVILVRDATVLIGNMAPQGNTCVGYKAHCIDFLPGYASDPVGQATIINGQLSIISFTTNPPGNEDQYSQGDIVIAGNVLYHNDFYAIPTQKSEMRQLSTIPTGAYTRSKTVNGPITNINDGAVEWVTNTDGTRYRDVGGSLVGSLDGLGLFATHDIKISVTPMGNGYTKATMFSCSSGGTTDNYVDGLTIHGQLVAGNRVRVHAHLEDTPIPNLQEIDLVSNLFCSTEPDYESYKDSLTFYGTVYSRKPVNFSEYFKIKREYYFDRSLQKNPLVGAPYYPQTAGDYKNQTVFNNFPSLVPGTWTQGAH